MCTLAEKKGWKRVWKAHKRKLFLCDLRLELVMVTVTFSLKIKIEDRRQSSQLYPRTTYPFTLFLLSFHQVSCSSHCFPLSLCFLWRWPRSKEVDWAFFQAHKLLPIILHRIIANMMNYFHHLRHHHQHILPVTYPHLPLLPCPAMIWI